jgi:hypothetical protein
MKYSPSRSRRPQGWVAFTILAALIVVSATSFAGDGTAPPDGRIAYVATDMSWSVYQTADGKAECPGGFNEYGPREVFAKLYPKGGAEADTRLVRESLKLFPMDSKDQFPMPEAKGPTAIGLNLDGKIGPRDFTSPSGEPGIDNELYRLIGCNRQFRGPTGEFRRYGIYLGRQSIYNRIIIEITGVDSLKNDDAVTVTILRGLDPLLTDASAEQVLPGGTQRVDNRFSKRFYVQLKGKIVNGQLRTEPAEVIWPWSFFYTAATEYRLRAARFQLDLTDTKAAGLLGSYVDVESFYSTLNMWSMHHLAYGQLDPSGFYRKLRQLADAYPDGSGGMTAISSSINISMSRVFLDRSQPGNAGVARGSP